MWSSSTASAVQVTEPWVDQLEETAWNKHRGDFVCALVCAKPKQPASTSPTISRVALSLVDVATGRYPTEDIQPAQALNFRKLVRETEPGDHNDIATTRRWRCTPCPVTRKWAPIRPRCGLAEDRSGGGAFLCLRDLDVDWRGDVHREVDRVCDGKRPAGCSSHTAAFGEMRRAGPGAGSSDGKIR